MMKAILGWFAGVALILSTSPAAAQRLPNVMAVERQVELCTDKGPDGRYFVNRGRLAFALVHESGLPTYVIDYGNSLGVANGSVTEDEVKWLIETLEPERSDRIPERIKANKGVSDALEALGYISADFGGFLNGLGSGSYPGYRVKTSVDRTIRPSDFLSGTNVEIECLQIPGSPLLEEDNKTGKRDGEENGDASALLKSAKNRVILRGKLEDLKVRKSQLRDASAAQVSFRDNRETDEESFQTKLVFGIDATPNTDADRAWSLIPHVQYELAENDGDDDDIHVVSPGLLYDYLFAYESWLAAHVGVSVSGTLDLEQNAETAKLKGFFDPTIVVGSPGKKTAILGSWDNLIGPILYRPNVTLLAELAHVFDAGKSGEFDGTDEYFGLGGEASMGLRLRGVPILSNIRISATYRHLELLHGDIDRVNRFVGALEYAFGSSSNYSLKVSYEDGENSETFQDEEFWGITLGLRF